MYIGANNIKIGLK